MDEIENLAIQCLENPAIRAVFFRPGPPGRWLREAPDCEVRVYKILMFPDPEFDVFLKPVTYPGNDDAMEYIILRDREVDTPQQKTETSGDDGITATESGSGSGDGDCGFGMASTVSFTAPLWASVALFAGIAGIGGTLGYMWVLAPTDINNVEGQIENMTLTPALARTNALMNLIQGLHLELQQAQLKNAERTGWKL